MTARAHVDFETRSYADLLRCGAHVYAADPSTDILVMAWCLGDGPVLPWRPGEPFPEALAQHIAAGGEMWAHNAQFERLIWQHAGRRHGFPPVRLDQWHCTAALAANMGLPRSLGDAAAALGGEQPQKDPTGRRVMLKLSQPRRDGGGFWARETAPADFAHLDRYCIGDVKAERGLTKRLYAIQPIERDIYLLDQRINDRGIRLDRVLVAAMQEIVDAELARIDARIGEITGYAATAATQVARILSWCQSRGVSLPGLAAGDIRHALKHTDMPNDVEAVLLLRQEAAKSSTAKLQAFTDCAGNDDRCRGLLLYAGAARTRRWAGRLAQPQNLPRGSLPEEDMSSALGMVLRRETDGLRAIYGSALDAVSSLLRGCLVAEASHDLLSADYANIEGRALAWLAGEEWKLEAFRAFDRKEGPDLYRVAYSRAMGTPVRDVTSKQRQVGKVIELACLGPDTLVATRSAGWIPLSSVTVEHEVWDGAAWVKHLGLVDRGARETILLDGVRVTADHLVMAGSDWIPAGTVASCGNTLASALATGSAAWPSWSTDAAARCESNATAAPLSTKSASTTCATGGQPGATLAPSSGPGAGSSTSTATPTCAPTTPIGAVCATAFPPASSGAATRKPSSTETTAAAASACTPPGLPTAGPSWPTSSGCPAGMTPGLTWTESTTTGATSPVTCASSVAGRIAETAEPSRPLSEKTRTYDLLCAGPNNRFLIRSSSGAFLVHNCGYQGWTGAFQAFATLYGLDIPDHEAAQFAGAWRDAHPATVRFWHTLNDAALRAVATPGRKFAARGVEYLCANDYLWCRLPSRGVLAYCRPALKKNDRGEIAVHFWGVDSVTKRWVEIGGYGGLWAENATQAVCRDLLAGAMLRLDRAGYPIVLTVHDEIVCEMPRSRGSLDEMRAMMTEIPAWADGLPVVAEGWRGERYRK